MPKIYGANPILRYWYVPVAAALAVLVAFGVVWAADRLSSDNPVDPAGALVATPTPLTETNASPGPSASPAATVSPSAPTVPVGSGTSTKFKAGNVAVVTGAGDCLNVRVAPGRSNDAIVCLKDGEQVTVTGGPEAAGDLQWWKVRTKLGEGWAAEDYLSKLP